MNEKIENPLMYMSALLGGRRGISLAERYARRASKKVRIG